jgi:hypothetical protein
MTAATYRHARLGGVVLNTGKMMGLYRDLRPAPLADIGPRIATDGLVALAMSLERREARPEPVRVLGWV